ncbi:MAG: hypothetical protein M3Q65_19925 [Chloroflexota bacterium]|nr:hypothetical protein [Chloroflexota bacterium]
MQLHRRSRPRPPQVRPRYAGTGMHDEAREWRRAAWITFWLLAIGKLVTMIVIAIVGLASLTSAERTFTVVALLNWSWILLAIILVAGPIAYWLRMRRVRRKRAALLYAEWHVD